MINANKNTIELYIHIPFCVKKCFYCDFLSFRALAADHEAYVDQLVREIRARGAFCSELTVSTVFIGGGTPTVMEPELIRRIMEAVKGKLYIGAGCGDYDRGQSGYSFIQQASCVP